ncbi:hypothetical protein BCR32DRAFT_263985 [Anaeromyces robustus]|uniref:Uncharacterized protein n=1 Tax=Anaeromyces robustus TaxID=1754192 RepID=A0A1Y1XQB9_9FUNG|nr:hypothetical protein BCR32DRAFT_263985 [Anaeromyces robustus]|eukprot:ORX87933.1 hypothetical protein BCR32DRAFT_263985 [Anaeromyces robustus]
MSFMDQLLHPTSFLGLTDLRMGTIILAIINFLLILSNFGGGGNSLQYLVYSIIAVVSLICTFLGAWGAFHNNLQHVTYYYYYCFVNVVIAVYNCIMSLISVLLWLTIVNIFFLIVAIYTLSIVKGYLGSGNSASGAAATV